MANKTYFLSFGSGNPTAYAGFSPTFLVFKDADGNAVAGKPGITEIPSSTGLYYFNFTPTLPIAFVVDGGASLISAIRYIVGNLDPLQMVDQVLGSTASSFGSTSADPSTVMGYVKRNQEWNEGNSTFGKSSGVWNVSSRGSSTLLAQKTVTDSAGATNVTKT